MTGPGADGSSPEATSGWSAATQRWLRLSWLALLPGMILAPMMFPLATVLAIAITTTGATVLTLTLIFSAPGTVGGRAPVWRIASALVYGLASGVAAVATAATVAFSPWMTVLLVAFVLLTSPWTLLLTRHHPLDVVSPQVGLGLDAGTLAPRSPDQSLDGAGPNQGRDESVALQSLTNSELCTAWRASFVELARATSATQRSRIVARRQAYLDEMETRDPRALSAWLDSGARAASGPDRYLQDDSRPPE